MGVKSNFLKNIYLEQDSSVVTTSRIITAATITASSCFQGQPWGGFTSTNFFWVLPHQKHPSRSFLLAKYGSSIRRFSINSCSEYFGEITRKKSVTELIFSIALSFQYVLWCKWFSRNFLKIFRNSFFKKHSWWDAPDFVWLFLEYFENNAWCNKRHTYLSKPSTETLSMYALLLPPALKG